MPRDLFGQMTRPFEGVGARSRLTVPLSLAAHAVAVVAILVVPLLATDTLPSLHTSLSFDVVTPVVPPAPPPPRSRPPADTPVAPDVNAAPVDAPYGFAPEPVRLPVEADGPDIGVVPGGVSSSADLLPPPPPPPPAPRPAAIRVSSGMTPPTKVRDAAPVYPAIAQAARVQGIVIIEATIGLDGAVVDARALRSVPLLDAAALQAVRQWRYTPTRLDGQPVGVIMTVTVNFQLR
jgi:protein TonB